MDSPTISQKDDTQNCTRPPQKQIIYYCQVVAIYLIVIACLVNLSVGTNNDTVWASMLSASIGYLLPSPKFRKNRNESLLSNPTIELVAPILPKQHNDGFYDKTGVDSGIDE